MRVWRWWRILDAVVKEDNRQQASYPPSKPVVLKQAMNSFYENFFDHCYEK